MTMLSPRIIAPSLQEINSINNQEDLDNQLIALQNMYYNDPNLFAVQILNVKPDAQQRGVLYSIKRKKRTTVKSGRGAGKTWTAGMIIWWFLCTRYNAQIYVTAASGGTMMGAIWPTVSVLHQGMHPLFKDDFEVQATQIKHKINPNTWFCITRTAKKEKAEAMAGAHNKDMLYVIDESSGVDDEIFKSVFGSLTEEENYLLMLSNPRRLSGFFYNSFKPINNTVYDQITMSAINSDFVTPESIEHWKRLYGEESNTYRIEVLGEFPDREDNSIIPWDMVNQAADREKEEVDCEGMLYWGLDVAAGGGDSSVLTQRRGNLVYNNMKKYNEKDTMKLVGIVANKYFNLKKENRPDKIFVDANSIGKGAFDRMKELKLPVVGVLSQEKAFDQKYYVNRRAEMWIACRDWFRDELVSIPKDMNLIEQLTTVRSTPHSSGRFLVEGKKDYIKRNPAIGSPDYADSLIMTFYRKRQTRSELIFI